MPGEGILSTFSLPLAVLKFLGGKLFATKFYIFIIKGTKRTRIYIKGTKRTLILSSKKQTNHKLIIIKGKKTRVLSKEPTNHKLSKELSEIIKKNYNVCQLDDVPINDTNKAMMLR